ncbi:hypothetical protein QBC45DRAFT_99946 [Copromyces sp. CBS 386.78]|nr:hypothetical protein QBC45DRAFT_99946 [Copromyces sp. CBS 386.78]
MEDMEFNRREVDGSGRWDCPSRLSFPRALFGQSPSTSSSVSGAMISRTPDMLIALETPEDAAVIRLITTSSFRAVPYLGSGNWTNSGFYKHTLMAPPDDPKQGHNQGTASSLPNAAETFVQGLRGATQTKPTYPFEMEPHDSVGNTADNSSMTTITWLGTEASDDATRQDYRPADIRKRPRQLPSSLASSDQHAQYHILARHRARKGFP